MSRSAVRIVMALLIVAAIVAFVSFDLASFLSLDYIKTRQSSFERHYAAHRAGTMAAYVAVYVAITAVSIPGAAVMTLAGGALFGLVVGVVLVSIASTTGATLAFLMARFLFRDAVRARFGDRIAAIDDGIARDGAAYLFTLRLIPVFPFFVINVAMALTPMRVATFFLVSQVGMLPATVVYVNAGTQLAKIDSLEGLLSVPVLVSFAILGLLPITMKKAVAFVRSRHAGRRGDSDDPGGSSP